MNMKPVNKIHISHPKPIRLIILLRLVGWQWVFIIWGLPAVIVGIVILFYLTDWPHQAKWLTDEEREALEEVLAREKLEQQNATMHMTVLQAL